VLDNLRHEGEVFKDVLFLKKKKRRKKKNGNKNNK